MEPEIINRLDELLTGDPEAESEDARRGYLKTKGISVEQFARQIGVTRTIVYFYINDQARPTLDTLIKICDVVGISLAEGVKICTPRTRGRPFKTV
jgi:transcriptional regulator with XRE-family HTH domain